MLTLPKSRRELEELVSSLEKLASHKRFNRLDFFTPYLKQLDFVRLSATHRETAILAGNQLGKTEIGAVIAAIHLTGRYPKWWRGRRYERPVRWWICGETSLVVRDVQQKKLCGQPGVESEFGTGFLPKDTFADRPTLTRGVTDAYDTIQVRHASGGISTGIFKSYEQGRQKHQAESVDGIWDDEEPPMDIYGEHLARIAATQGLIYCTFTPLKGMSDVVDRYLNEASPDRGYVQMGIRDALHIPESERERIIMGYPIHEREARANGVPMLGAGRVFDSPESQISEPRISLAEVPHEWRKLWSLDFGTQHPFAAVLTGWDEDTDTGHVLHSIRMSDATRLTHIAAIRAIAANVPVAWPHDMAQRRESGDGELLQLARLYKYPSPGTPGLLMLPSHATFKDGSMSTTAGVQEMNDRFQTGRLLVGEHLTQWFEEYRLYRYEDGLIVKKKDDLLSATRIGIMARRFARPGPIGSDVPVQKRPQRETPYDPWTGLALDH